MNDKKLKDHLRKQLLVQASKSKDLCVLVQLVG